jgi:hypothetical protein
MPRPGSVKTLPDVRSLARSYTALAVNTLAGIARSPKCPPAARVAASIALLDRGYGRPPQDHTGDDSEIRVTIRHIGPGGESREAKVIEHEPIGDGNGELD